MGTEAAVSSPSQAVRGLLQILLWSFILLFLAFANDIEAVSRGREVDIHLEEQDVVALSHSIDAWYPNTADCVTKIWRHIISAAPNSTASRPGRDSPPRDYLNQPSSLAEQWTGEVVAAMRHVHQLLQSPPVKTSSPYKPLAGLKVSLEQCDIAKPRPLGGVRGEAASMSSRQEEFLPVRSRTLQNGGFVEKPVADGFSFLAVRYVSS